MIYTALKILTSSAVTEFKYELNGTLTDAEVMYTNKDEDYRIVLVKGFNSEVLKNAQIKVSIPSANYNATHSIRLNFNNVNNNALSSAYIAASTKLRNAKVGTEVGQYSAESVATFKGAVEAAGKAAVKPSGTQAETNAAVEVLNQAVTVFAASAVQPGGGVVVPPVTPPGSIVDGKYTLNYRILKNGTSENSVMDEYVAHPGRLLVQNGVKYVQIRLRQSNEITGFKVLGVTPTTIESDPAANTRLVQFTVSDLTAKPSGWVKIDWKAVNYHHEYDIQIEFGTYTKVNDWGSDGFGTVIDSLPPVPGTPTDGKDHEEEKVEESEDSDTGTSGTATFSDSSKHWAKEAIARAINLGIINGYKDGTFKPNATITRAEWTAILMRALKIEGKASTLTLADQDNIQAWAKPFVEQALSVGIISGYSDQTFRPLKKVTRAEIAIMVVKALNLPLESAESLTFADKDQFNNYAKPYIATAVKYRLMNGQGNNRFAASGEATRAESVTLVLRAIDYLEAKTKEATKANK